MPNINKLLAAKLATAALILATGAAVSTATYTAQHVPASTSATGGVNNNPGPNSASPSPASV